MSRLLIASAALIFAGVIAEAGIAPPVPRLPSAVLERLKGDEPRVEIRSPEEIAERIQQNTKAAADRLAASDPGEETRKKQGQALKDLDELLKQAQDPMSGQGGGQGQQKDDKSQQGEQQSKSGGPPKSGQSKGGGSGQQSKKQGWRNRGGKNGSAQKQQPTGNPQQAKGQQPMGKEPTPTSQGQPQPLGPGDLKNAGGNPGGGARKGVPALPLDETITKQVWGHLPERLRQQMSQYYKEQFMPKYSDMLRRYYAALAEREKAQKKP